jgi:L-gulono-1,4-lactone dehydrogenase
VPAFNLRAVETVEPVTDVISDFGGVMRSADHVEFFWMPGSRKVQVKRNSRTTDPVAPQRTSAYVRDKWIGENLAFGALCRTARRFPKLAPKVAGIVMSGAGERELVDRSDRVFCSPRHVRFLEMEYGVPFDAVPDALGRIAELVRTLPYPPLFPIEVRASAADDIPLSTAHSRPSGWIAIHQYRGAPYEAYFQGVEQIMNDYAGRPHWGKLHHQSAATLAHRYPEWDTFASWRAELDPAGTFRNPYLDRVLGHPSH